MNSIDTFISLDVLEDSSEIVHYDSDNLPIRSRRSWLSYFHNLSAVCHWHDDVEFIVVLQGEMTYFVNGETYLLKKGMGIFVNAGQLHYGFSESGTDCEFLVLLFHPRSISTNAYIESEYVLPFIHNHHCPLIVFEPHIPWQAESIQVVKDIFTICQKKEKGYELSVQSLLYSLWLVLYKNAMHKDHSVKKIDFSELKAMIGYIQLNYSKKISLEKIARAGAVSRSKCCQLFKDKIQMSPIQYLNRFRLERSMELLRNHSLSIVEVAHESGFSGASYYTELFHREIGMTPSEFRMMYNSNKQK
ncbi:AraC family transcriptional regulator [Domibacillus robiginosus]|uniref:AraC family transcriptional regulator n=1 Tax=Domibacillus robiginosus TaxID=1071054 RepID=UPI00067BBDBF|nr:AraC family transcriptional regulator [Domibacillus robiginosus]